MMTTPDILTDADIHAITQQVWASVLDASVEPIGGVHVPPSSDVRAGVHIAGPWSGEVSVHCSSRLAATITGQMLEMESDETERADIVDAIGEIANMIGGNVKALLPGPSTLSLPAVEMDPVEAGVPISSARQPSTTWQFDVGGERLLVTITAATADGSTAVDANPLPTHEGTTQ